MRASTPRDLAPARRNVSAKSLLIIVSNAYPTLPLDARLLGHALRGLRALVGRRRAAAVATYWSSKLLGCRVGEAIVFAHTASGVLVALPMVDHNMRTVALTQQYDSELSHFARLVIRSGDIAVDVGANLGLHALNFGVLVGPHGSVLACEPAPGPRRLLEASIAANQFGSRVRLIPSAVGASAGTASLYLDDGIGLMNSLLPEWTASSILISVDVITLDDLLAAHGDGRPLGLLKVDAEGSESAVFAGAHKTIAERKPRGIALEMTSFTDTLTLVSAIEANGYIRVVRSTGSFVIDRSSLRPASGASLRDAAFSFGNLLLVHQDSLHEVIGSQPQSGDC